jgi:hypothetical protein
MSALCYLGQGQLGQAQIRACVSVNMLAEIHSCQSTTSQPPPQIRVTITTTGVGDLLRTTQQLLPRINSPATLNIIRLGNTPNGPAD